MTQETKGGAMEKPVKYVTADGTVIAKGVAIEFEPGRPASIHGPAVEGMYHVIEYKYGTIQEDRWPESACQF